MTRDQELAAQMKLKFLPVAASFVALAAALAVPAVSALDLLASDAAVPTRTSFSGTTANSTNWDGSGPATPENDYRVATSGFIIRGFSSANNGTVTFQGKSLTLLDNTLFQMRGGLAGVTFDAKKLIIGDGTNASTATAVVASGATTYTLAASTNIEILANGTLRLDAGGGEVGRGLIVSAPMTGGGNVLVGTAVTTIGAGPTTLTSTNNTYAGNTTVTGTGLLLMGAENALPHNTTSGDLIVSANTIVLPPVNPGSPGGIFRLNNFDTTIQGLADGVGGGTVENGGASLKTLTIQGNTAGDRTFSGIIQDGSGGGALALTKTGSGTREILTGVNTYTGSTTISGGTLEIQDGSGLGGTAAGTSIEGTGTLALSGNIDSAEALTLAGRTTGIGTVPDPLNAHIDNSSGDNALSGGLALGNTVATTENYNIVSSAGMLTISQPVSGDAITGDAGTDIKNLNLGGAGDGEVKGAINMGAASGGGANIINKVGGGTWSLNSTAATTTDINAKAGTLVFGDAIAYSGTVTIDNGAILKQGATGAFAGKTMQVNGDLDLNGLAASLPGLNDDTTGTGSVTNSSASAAVLTITGDGSFAGDIKNGPGAVSLTMNGDGKTQVLSGGGDYSGQTTVSGGTLEIRSNNALGDPAGVSQVDGTGTLALRSTTSLSSGESLTLVGRADNNPVHVNNAGGNNTLGAAAVTLKTAGSGTDNYNLNIDAGNLSITGDIDGNTLTGGASNLNLSGESGTSGLVLGAITMKSGAANILNKTGTGAWTLASPVSNLTTLNAAAGTLTLGSDIMVAGDINVDGALKLEGTNATSQGLTGTGTVSDADESLLTVGGASAIGDKTFSGVIADGTGTVSLTKVGENRQILSGAADNTYSGLTTVSGGTLQIEKDKALGGASSLADGTVINTTGVLALSGAISSGEYLSLEGRGSTPAHIQNISGGNTLAGVVTLVNAPSGTSNFNIVSSAGTLTMTGGISGTSSTNDRNLNLSGNGSSATGAIAMGGGTGTTTINKNGVGTTWTLDSEVTGVDEIKANEGTLAIGAGGDVSDVNTFRVASGAVIDATAVVSGFHLEAGQTLQGGGQVKGNITADGGSIIDIGSSPGTLTITGSLTLAATSLVNVEIDVAGTGDDFLAVSGLLTLGAGNIFAFTANNGALMDGLAYVFASYGTLAFDPVTAGCANVGVIPDGFYLDCAYGGKQLALVNETPVPAPLFLIGLGALALGASRRYAKW